MVNLLVTSSYYGVFNALTDSIGQSCKKLSGKNLIFCEEKVSLMAERTLCSAFNGSFNTEVYSFGNYLRVKKPNGKALTKEGSAMVIKRILSSAQLYCFKAGKTTLAPTLYELISQLKSAGVTYEDLEQAIPKVNGVLKNKLIDITNVFFEYERYLKVNDYDDQSSMLSYLPAVLESQTDLNKTDVFLVGFSSFTKQVKDAIKILIKKAKSVTAILIEGQNNFAFVNETAKVFRRMCHECGVQLRESKAEGKFCEEAEIIAQNMFSPLANQEKINTQKIYAGSAKNAYEEIERIASVIKQSVIEGKIRYKDVSLALADSSFYKEHIKTCFELLDIPYFLDEKKKPDNHPLVNLVLTYIDIQRKGLEKDALSSFIKNPLLGKEKTFTDKFIKHVNKYNLFYSSFTQSLDEEVANGKIPKEFEEFRQLICKAINCKNVKAFLELINVKAVLESYTAKLLELNQAEEAAVNQQIYEAVLSLLTQMQTLLSGVELSWTEYKNVFVSGVSAMELSIIPQYNDAVFVGGFKEIALYPAKYLFVPGLTTSVPNVKDDVALLADSDIDLLADIKVMIEPKIKVVNHRVKEAVALGVSAFTEKLFVSYPLTSDLNAKNVKGEVYSFITQKFITNEYPEKFGYLTDKQSKLSFAKDCSDFYENLTNDLTEASSYYYIKNHDEKLFDLAMQSSKKQKIKLEENERAVISSVISPTTIEDYHKCPYMSFLSHGLGLRREEDGKVDALSYGNVMHEIFALYVKKIEKVTDLISSEKLFDSISAFVLQKDEYKRLLKDEANASGIARALAECKKFCNKTYKAFCNSEFKTLDKDVEVGFGDGKTYPAISLLNGKVKMVGKIDRVDTCGEYCRVIDYKTGSVDVEGNKLFAGLKLQLYLYAWAIKDKKIAGMYYLPVNDAFKSKDKKQTSLVVGKTLNDNSVILKQQKKVIDGEDVFLPISQKEDGQWTGASSEENINAMVKYAVKVSEKATEQMVNGVIVASPYEGACEYCPYLALCGREIENGRKVRTISETTIRQAVEGDEQCHN